MAKKVKGPELKLESKEEIKKKYSSIKGQTNKSAVEKKLNYMHNTNALRKQIKNSKDPAVAEIRNTYKKFKSGQEKRMKEAESKPVTRVVKKNK